MTQEFNEMEINPMYVLGIGDPIHSVHFSQAHNRYLVSEHDTIEDANDAIADLVGDCILLLVHCGYMGWKYWIVDTSVITQGQMDALAGSYRIRPFAGI